MRAGTRMPGFSPCGISHTQSAIGTVFMARPSDVDDHPRAPAAGARLEREQVERHGLGVGGERRARAVDCVAPEPGGEPARRLAAHVHLHLGEDELLGVLEEDQLGEPVEEQQVQRGGGELDPPLDRAPDRSRVHHELGHGPCGGREEIVEILALDLHRAVGDGDRLEELVAAHNPLRRSTRGYSAFTGIVVPFAVGAFGSVTVRTPCLKVALTFAPSTAAAFTTTASFVSAMSIFGVHSPTSSSSSQRGSKNRSNSRSISRLNTSIPVHGVSARMLIVLLPWARTPYSDPTVTLTFSP